RFYWKGILPFWLTPDPFFKNIPPPAWKIVLQDLVLKWSIV
ncbi:MAG: hypothetical protein JWQ35_1077, partial [Bacteriovoracaceae bacterium]|nr:hypothetical protein [Bacteriovoracaceae bacterium]